MKPGARPKPTKLKKLEGNGHKERWNLKEPQPVAEKPTCPVFLNEPAKAEWKRIVPELDKIGLLSQIDRAALAAYCEAYGEFVICCRLLKGKSPLIKSAKDNIIHHPLIQQKHKAMELLHKYIVEFGMTPSSRTRIEVTQKEADDELDKMLSTISRVN